MRTNIMVYVDMYADKDKRGYYISEAKTFRSLNKMLKYCYEEKKANYVIIEPSFDSSFDYIVRLREHI